MVCSCTSCRPRLYIILPNNSLNDRSHQVVDGLVPDRCQGEGGCDEVSLALRQGGHHSVEGAVWKFGAPLPVLSLVQAPCEVHLAPSYIKQLKEIALKISSFSIVKTL